MLRLEELECRVLEDVEPVPTINPVPIVVMESVAEIPAGCLGDQVTLKPWRPSDHSSY